MRPETHHRVSLGTLIALVATIVGAAIAWGQLHQQVDDHVEPDRHALIVLAGSVQTGEKIVALDTKHEALKEQVDEIQTDVGKIRDAASDAKAERAAIKAALDALLGEIRRQNGGDP